MKEIVELISKNEKIKNEMNVETKINKRMKLSKDSIRKLDEQLRGL